MRRKVNFIKASYVPFQEVGLKSMMICVRDLSGMGTKHDPLSVNYIVTGGECCTDKINASMTSEHARMVQMFSARLSARCVRSQARSPVTSYPCFNTSPFCVASTTFKYP